MLKQKYEAYAVATQTVARTRQIVMLYDGAIRFIQQAMEAIREKRIEDRYHLLTRATDITTGLQCCLDFDHGGEIAHVLQGFYSSIDRRLYSVHHSNSLETCQEVIDDLKRMRDVWDEIDHKNGNDDTLASHLPVSDVMSDGEPEQQRTLSA